MSFFHLRANGHVISADAVNNGDVEVTSEHAEGSLAWLRSAKITIDGDDDRLTLAARMSNGALYSVEIVGLPDGSVVALGQEAGPSWKCDKPGLPERLTLKRPDED